MKTLWLLLAMTAQLLFFTHGIQAGESVSFIVHRSNAIAKVTTAELVDFFLKKKRAWPNGNAIRFIDHQDDSAERTLFLKSTMKQSARAIDLYWIGQKLTTGDTAPLQVASDSLVATLVAQFPGAIGYVSSDFPLSGRVKKITVTGN